MAGQAAADLEYKKAVSRELCWAVKEPTLEALESHAGKHGLTIVQAWRAPRGEGFKAAAARFIVDAEDVLIVAFRATIGNDEWLEYPQKYFKQRLIPHDGESPALCVFIRHSPDCSYISTYCTQLQESRLAFDGYSVDRGLHV